MSASRRMAREDKQRNGVGGTVSRVLFPSSFPVQSPSAGPTNQRPRASARSRRAIEPSGATC